MLLDGHNAKIRDSVLKSRHFQARIDFLFLLCRIILILLSEPKLIKMENADFFPVSSLETSLAKLLNPLRSAAHDAVDDLMTEAFTALSEVLVRTIRASDLRPSFDKSICGLSPALLRQLYEKGVDGTLKIWLPEALRRDRYRLLTDFLDLYRLRIGEFRTRFPKAYAKWSLEEDTVLLERYKEVESKGTGCPWREWESLFGRNQNALKLRLGKLGIDLGDQTGQRSFFSR